MIHFGPSGNDVLFYEQGYKSSVDAPKWLHERGLDAYEISFGLGVKMKQATAEKIGAEARKYGITVSVHAPFYINLANPDVDASYMYIKNSIQVLEWIDSSDGPKRLVVHTGSQMKMERGVALENCRRNLKIVADRLRSDGFSNFLLCIETMGRYKAIGNIAEICDLCAVDPCIIPTIDFGHVNALLQGEFKKSPEKMCEQMDFILSKIGSEKMQKIHIHFVIATFTEKGEHAHTVISDEEWNFPFEPIARYIKSHKLEPVIICESEDRMAQDVIELKKIYEGVK